MRASVQHKKEWKRKSVEKIVMCLFGNSSLVAGARSARFLAGRNRSTDGRHALDRTNPLPWQPVASEMFFQFFIRVYVEAEVKELSCAETTRQGPIMH
jgi:hypothetical protein